MNQNPDSDLMPSVQTNLEAASAGLWGLVITALMREGIEATLVSMAAVQAGRAFVKCELVFTERGVSAQGHFCSHGTPGLLFSVELNPDSDLTPSAEIYMEAASVGLWGLALSALMREGKQSALASMDAVQAGRAFVKCELLFTKRGVSAEGHFCSHGAQAHLYSVTLRQPTAPPAASSLDHH